MDHTTCRQAVADGDLTPAAQSHLEGCPGCARFTETMRELLRAAPALAPPEAPPDLAGRVVARVRATSGPAVLSPRPVPSGGRASPDASSRPALGHLRRPLLSTLSAAAMVVALLGALAILPGNRDDEGDKKLAVLLTAAAERTAAFDRYRLRFEGSADMKATLPTPPAPGAVTPPSVELPPLPSLEGLGETERRQLEERYQELRRQFEEMATSSRLAIPRELSLSLAFDGAGEVIQPDRLHVRGTARATSVAPFVPLPPPSDFEVTVVGDQAYRRNADGTWAKMPVRFGPLASVVLDTDTVVLALRHPSGPLEDLGVEDLEGHRVRHLRFQVSGSSFGSDASYRTEAWVDAEDDVIRKLTMTTTGSLTAGQPMALRWSESATMRLFDFGAPLTVEPPAPGEIRGSVEVPEGASVLVYPFHTSLSFHVSSSGGSVGEPSPWKPQVSVNGSAEVSVSVSSSAAGSP